MSSQSTREQDSDHQSGSASIGVGFGLGGQQNGFTIELAAAAARSEAEGDGITHQMTQLNAGNTLTLSSGRDTTLHGAQAIGQTVLADVGRNLTLTTTQDSNSYDQQDQSAGFSASICVPPICYGTSSFSVSVSQTDIDSNYRSSTQQTGIQAGAGGFDIQVGGHTALTGAAIASTANPALNRLSTQSLSATDLKNEAAYEAVSVSVSGGTNGGASGSFSQQDDTASSTTRSGISAGTLDVRDGSTVASLDRSVTELQQDGLKAIFDEQKVAERMELGQVAGEVAFTAAKDVISMQRDRAEADAKAAQAALLAAEGNPVATEQAKQQLVDANQRLAQWNDGGAYKQTTQALAGVLTAAVGGNDVLGAVGGVMLNEQLLTKFSTYLQQKGSDPDSASHDSIMNLMGVVLGAAGGLLGGDVGTGAAVGSAGQQFGYYDYRDGRAHRQETAAQALAELGITDEATLAGVNGLLDNCVKLGCDPSQLNLLLQSPDAAKMLTDLAKPESTAYAMYGKGFNELSQAEQESVIARLGTATVSVSSIENLTSDGSSLGTVALPPEGQASEDQASLRTQFGTVLSGMVVTGGKKVEQVTDWLGAENAQTAAMLLMAALGGPVKTGASYLFDSSPAGQALQTGKDKYFTTPLANNVVAPYGFGAETDADRQAVNPASYAVSTMMVDAIFSALGLQAARKGAQGIVTAGGGFGNKVDAADAVPKGQADVLGGPHKQTSQPMNDGFDSHHCPAKSCYRDAPISSADGPAIKMGPGDHVNTASYGNGAQARAYRDRQQALLNEGKLLEAIQMDIDDIRKKFGNKYDEHIKQMVEHAKKLDPNDFKPGGGK